MFSQARSLLWLLPLLALVLAWWLAAQRQAPATERLAVDPACDVASSACRLTLPSGGSVNLSFSPRPPRLMKPIKVEVMLDGKADRIWLDLVGLNMEMGPNRGELHQTAEGLWQGELIIPVCGAVQMDWEARVMVVHEGETLEAPFPFATRP